MKKIDEKILVKLEQLYHSSMDNLDRMSSRDGDYSDVPDIKDDSEYKTNLPIPSVECKEPDIKTKSGKNILREFPPEEIDDDLDLIDEQDDTDEEKDDDNNGMGSMASDNINTASDQNNETGEDPNIDPNQENPEMNNNSMMGGDMSGMNQNVDPMTGQPIKTAEQVGKIFELKKIYSRLLAIESQLSFSADIDLLKLRKYITNAIELFETLISNIDAFQNDIDEIIVMYYQFLEETYEIMKKYYKIQRQKEKKDENK